MHNVYVLEDVESGEEYGTHNVIHLKLFKANDSLLRYMFLIQSSKQGSPISGHLPALVVDSGLSEVDGAS